jgi:hypothetical protein
MTDTLTLPPWQDPTTGAPYPINRLMGMILADLPAIGRNSENREQGFAFRGIDDTKNALNPLLARYGVFYLPDVIERVCDRRTTRNGGTMYEVNLHVRYTFYGPAGDSVSGSTWGEGTDSGDKATNKGMTGAEKQMLFQAFAIATAEQRDDDQDGHATEETVPAITCTTCLNEDGRSSHYPDPRQGGDPEPYRVHMIEAHGYVRLDDGRVGPPTTAPSDPTPPTAETPAPAPDNDPTPASAPTAEPAPDPAPVAEDPTPAPNPEIRDAEVAFVDKMKGSELAEQLKALNLKVGGTVAEMKDRLKDHLRGTAPAEAAPAAEAPAPTEEPPPPTDDEPSVEHVEIDGKQVPVPPGDPDAGVDRKDPSTWHYCPYVAEDGTECDVFPFTREADYIDHWNTTHEPAEDTPSEPAAEAPAEDAPAMPTEDMLADFRKAIGDLRGANARAYGAYRKKSNMPTKVEDMTLEQVVACFDFIEALPAT